MFKSTFLAFSLMATSVALAADYRVEGRLGALQEVFSSGRIAPGDRIVLASGHHGTLQIISQSFVPPRHNYRGTRRKAKP